jgi:uncharacterized protein (TIGR04255 family)
MVASYHPTYQNPTIREVVCEIRFQLSDGADWDVSWYNKFFKQIETDFPTFQPVNLPPIFVNSPDSKETQSLLVPLVIRYKHESRNLLLQLSENYLTVNILPTYPGWQQVVSDIKYAWNNFCQVAQPKLITRLGLRYINGIERNIASERLEYWLKPCDYIPSVVLRSAPGFSSRVTTRLDTKNRLTVVLSDQTSDNSGTFIFDIDRISEQSIEADIELLLQQATKMHDDVWEVFNSAKNDNLEQLLQGEL